MSRLLAFALVLGTGCVAPFSGLNQRRDLKTEVGSFELRWKEGDPDPERTARAIELAAPSLLRWGAIPKPVTFSLLPSHLRLVSAVGRFGYDWLHAWARYDEVYLQSPSTWGATDAGLNELVVHELTHCLMYQRSATKETWPEKQIPLWFREGMATWTANQGPSFPGLEDLARFYEQQPGSDPFARGDELIEDDSQIVYAAAHHGFTFLVRRYGEPAIPRLMDAMAAGQSFPDAFFEVTGVTSAAFAQEFRHYLVWRGFRGHGKPLLR